MLMKTLTYFFAQVLYAVKLSKYLTCIQKSQKFRKCFWTCTLSIHAVSFRSYKQMGLAAVNKHFVLAITMTMKMTNLFNISILFLIKLVCIAPTHQNFRKQFLSLKIKEYFHLCSDIVIIKPQTESFHKD